MKNIIQFRNGFVNLPNKKMNNYELALSVASELMQFGYVLDQSAIDNLTSTSKTEIVKFHNQVIKFLKDLTGSSRSYRPFWKGFPEEVMNKSEAELWVHQIVHYLSNGHYEPSDWTKARPTAFEQPRYTVITAGTEDQYLNIFTTLVSVNSSLTPEDLEYVKYFVSSGAELRFPSVIPFKENLCTLAAMGLDVPVKTVTDVLRIAVSMSGGDISLPAVPPAKIRTNRWSSSKSDNPYRSAFKFKKFSRKERKYLLGLLEKTNCDVREFALKDSRWIRLGEILHPGEYQNKYPKAFALFDDIRNTNVKTWYGEVNDAFKVGITPTDRFRNGVKKLSERPGELMRRLDSIIRTSSEDKKKILYSTIVEASGKTSNKVLFEVFNHFEKRDKPITGRSVMIKGKRKRTPLPDLKALKKSDIEEVQMAVIKSLEAKFSSLDPLGNVWIDEDLKKIPLPSNMRSMNAALRPTIRGQRVPIGNQNAKVIRAFVHWFDEHGNRDIDLTATYIGMGKTEHVGWNGHHNSKFGCYSGDIRHRKGACAEYIDINVDTALAEGFKYVVLDARNYNGGTLEEITDCVFGYMERENAKAGEIFVPKTLANTVRLRSASSNTIVAVVDLETREYIFLDIDQDGIPVASANFDKIMAAIKPYTELPKFSVYDLLKLHADTRGNIVEKREDAETQFDFDKFSTSYVETLKWMGV